MRRVSLLLLSSALVVAAPASAQEGRTGVAAGGQVDEIVVTARKKEESILEVPVVISVLTQDHLEAFQVSDLFSVAAHVPGLQLGGNVGVNGTQISLRGVGTAAVDPSIDQSVSLNLDGLGLTHGLAYSAGMFDVAQVEVLKGPQALFFGKNSPGGVVVLRSADPGDAVEVNLRAGYEFEAMERVGEIILSGPVSDSLKLRLATRFSDSEGFFRNDAEVIPDSGALNPRFRNLAPQQDLIMRGTVLFEPNDVYRARVKLNYSHREIDGNGGALQLARCPEGTGQVSTAPIAFIAGDDCKLDRHLRMAWMDPDWFPGIKNDGVPFMDVDQIFGTLEQTVVLSPQWDLTAVSAYYEMDMESLINGTGTGSSVSFGLENDYVNRQFSQELRLASNLSGPVNVMAGVFYQDGHLENNPRLPGNTRLGLPETVNASQHFIDIRSLSLFGQVLWALTPTVEAGIGGRWTDEERKHLQINHNAAQGPLGPTQRPDPKIEASNFSPELSLTWTPTDTMTLFASYKGGFKSGSFNTNQYQPPERLISFDDERVRGGEIGMKTVLLGHRLPVNVAGYYSRYQDLQVGAAEVTPQGTVANRTLNAASANVYGIDLDAAYTPESIEGLRIFGAVNWNRARYREFGNAPCGNGQTISQGCDQIMDAVSGAYTSQDLSGKPLVRAPDWQASFGLDYERPVFGDMQLRVGANTVYSSSYYTNVVTRPGWIQDSFFKTSASIALRDRADQWELALIGNNLGNEIISGNCYNSNAAEGSIFGGKVKGMPTAGPAGDDETNCITDPGRAVWLRLTVRLGDMFARR